MKRTLKTWWFALLGKDPDAVIVSFRSGNSALADAMCAEIRRLEPARRHFEVLPETPLAQLHDRLRGFRIGLVPVLFDGDPEFRAMRHAAFLLAPRRLLAYNGRLERHHLRWTEPLASWLFLHGVPLDRIYLRPRWLWPFRKDKTVRPAGHRVLEGRPWNPGRKSVAVLTPYFPYPLSHGGAVRMFNLLRETAREFNVVLYAFTEQPASDEDLLPVLDFATRVYLVEKPRYREPRWSTIRPPEVAEYESPEMVRLLAARNTDLLQTEYTSLASYQARGQAPGQAPGGDILVEHDVTFDLYSQVKTREATWSAWWNWWRWQRFERRAVGRFRRVVVMSEKDAALLGVPNARVIENGVDTRRFDPRPEPSSRRLLFIGSFRHFPNIVAFRFLTEQILPLVADFELTVVAGPDPWPHWRNYTGTLRPPEDPRIRMQEFVPDVRPLYHDANLVLVPTLESAGTNVKVLEAMAMQRAVVSTSSGCAGLGLRHGETIWIADSPADFAGGMERLLNDVPLREKIALAGREHVVRHFDWRAIGLKQRALLRELLGGSLSVRSAVEKDLARIASIQAMSPEAAQWKDASDYLQVRTEVAVERGQVIGFLAWRQTAPGESEILNLAIDAGFRGRGVAYQLVDQALAAACGEWFLEVRASNAAALRFYESLGFKRTGVRENYYDEPSEPAIVMRFFS